MSKITRYTSRILSAVLVIALLFTSGTTLIFAEEINYSLRTARPDVFAVDSVGSEATDNSDEAVLALLERIDEYETFTQNERRLLFQKLSIGYDEDEAAVAEAKADTEFYSAFEALPASTRSELKILKMDNEEKAFSDLQEEEKAVFYEYLNIAEEKRENFDSVLTQLSASGKSLFDSMLTAQMLADGLFSLAEAQKLTVLYPERADRDRQVDSFRAFTENFAKPDSVKNSSMVNAESRFAESEETVQLRASKAAYLNEQAFANAKQMLLNGTLAEDIIAAFSVAAVLNLSPNDLVIDRSEEKLDLSASLSADKTVSLVDMTEEEEKFLSIFPVNLVSVRGQLNTSSALMSNQKATTMTDLTKQTIEMQSALYSTTSTSGNTPGDDSKVTMPPFLADLTRDTGVSLNTGSSYHEVNLVNIPGVNGLDIDLGIQYSSADANTVQMNNTASGLAAYYAFVNHKTYLLYGSTQILYTEDCYMLQVNNNTNEADTFISSYLANDGTLEVVSSSIANTKTVDQTQIYRAVITGTYSPFAITSNSSSPIPSSLAHNDGTYSGTLTPYRSYTGYNSGMVQTGTNTWQQTVDTVVEFSGNVTAYSSVLLHTYPGYGILYLPVYGSVNSAFTVNEQRQNIGTGWSWNLPHIEIDSSNTTIGYLYFPEKGTLKFQNVDFPDGRYGFYNYSAEDIKLNQNTSYLHPQGIASKYYVLMKDGSGYHFSTDGRLLAHHNAQGNTLVYYYTSTAATGKLSAVVDTFGRTVTITRTITAGGENVTITTPDGNTTVLELTNLSWMSGGDLALTAITYPDQTRELFGYSQGTSYYSNSGKTPTLGTAVPYALLTSITYPTGAVLSYTYGDIATINHNIIGSRTIFRVTERKWTAGGVEYNKQTYLYQGEYTNYPNVCLALPQNYLFCVYVCENNGAYAQYYFDENHQLFTVYTYDGNGDRKFTTSYMYDDYGFLRYKSQARHENSETLTTIERYSYDKNGNLLSYFSPKANGDESKKQYRTTYSYNANNLPIQMQYMQDAAKTVTTDQFYSGYDLLQSVTSVTGQIWQQVAVYDYDLYGRLVLQRDFVNATQFIETGYEYTGPNLTAKTTYNVYDADGVLIGDVTEYYGYDAMGRMTSVTDGAGNTTQTTYDSRGRVTSVISPEGRTVTYTYDPILNTVTETASGKTPVKYTYNALGLLLSETLPALGVTQKTNTYDNRGRLISESNAVGTTSSGTTYYTYDVWDRVTETRVVNSAGTELCRETKEYYDTDPFGCYGFYTRVESNDAGAPTIPTRVGYNAYGEKIIDTAGNGDSFIQTTYEYDYAGNLVAAGKIFGAAYWQVTNYTYQTALGVPNISSVKETNYYQTLQSVADEYDGLGRHVGSRSGTTYAINRYDALNRVISEEILDWNTNAILSMTRYDYNGAGQVVRERTSNTAADSVSTTWKTVEYAYDDDGNLTDTVTHVDSLNKQYTHYVYDTAGNLTHEYSGMSTPWTATMPASAYKLTTYTYDSRGRLTQLTDGLGQIESYTYDNNNNLITKTLRDGKQERYTYNALGKIVTDNVYASATATTPLSTRTYTYYPTGALKSVTEDGTTLSYTYDDHGNMLTESDGTSTKTYTYTPYDARSSYTLTMNGETIASEEYTYDAACRLVQVYTDYANVTYSYDTNGNRTQDLTVLTNGTPISQQNYTYDAANRVSSVVGYVASGANVLVPVSESYTYYRDGSMHTKTSGGVTTTYTYDGAGRLTSESSATSSISYSYDAANNRTSMVNNGTLTTYTYDANNRMLTETEGGTTKAYTYDANGNQLTGDGATYTYNARGQQSGYSKDGVTASYTYLPTGLRKSKTVGITTTNYVWDGQNMVYEYNGTNTAGGTPYYYGLTLISLKNDAYYLYNAHGDVVQLVVSGGSLGWNYEYDAFGNETTLREIDANPFRYAGQYYDKETGTYYLRARYYNPSVGRFTQQDGWQFADPSDPLSLNLYTYCYGNPIKYYDPSGNAIDIIFDVASAAWSLIDLCKNPTFANFGFLVWDLGSIFIPFVTGSYVAKGGKLIVNSVKAADNFADAFKVLNKADRFLAVANGKVVAPYKQLKKVAKGLGLEVHHLIEKRFSQILKIDADEILSIAIDKDVHQAITNKMRRKIPYDTIFKKGTSAASPQDIWTAIVETYTDLNMTEYLPELKQQLINSAGEVGKITDWKGW